MNEIFINNKISIKINEIKSKNEFNNNKTNKYNTNIRKVIKKSLNNKKKLKNLNYFIL